MPSETAIRLPLNFEDLGEQEVENIVQPVHPYASPRRPAPTFQRSASAFNRLLNVSFALGDKPRIIAVVDEDMPHEAARGAQGDPPATACRTIVVEALP